MSTPSGSQQITGLSAVLESNGPQTAVHYVLTLASGTQFTIAGQCDALDAAVAQLRAGVPARVSFPLTLAPNPTLWSTTS